MSNSSLISYTKISPNKTSPRNHVIDTITIHCMAGNLTVESCGNVFYPSSRKASSNYGIGTDGRIALYVDEKDRSWASSNSANDNRAVTIEVANDGGASTGWHVSDKAMASLIKLCADICRRNSIKELKWKGDKSLIGQVDKQNMTVHRWFASKACPGDYLYGKHSYIAQEVNKLLGATTTTPTTSTSNSEFIKQVATYVKKYAPTYGVTVYSPIIAQACLESAYGTSELATKAHNYFGLKYQKEVSEKTAYVKVGSEQNADGSYTSSTMQWCAFSSLEKCVEGYFKFLFKRTGVTRYNNLKGITDPKKYLETIKADGYATSLTYVDNNYAVITKWNLTQYDVATTSTTTDTTVTFLVKVTADVLNVRKTPSTSAAITAKIKKGEKYTIVATQNGWGKLKSGVGWINLSYVQRY